MNAEATIEEARMLAGRVVEYERGQCGGDVDRAMFFAANKYGIDESSLRSLRYRWRSLRYVKAHVLEKLRQIDEFIAAKAERERTIIAETARLLEERGSASAGLARKIAELAGASPEVAAPRTAREGAEANG